jgi:GTP:adenosylcobinamide-phosphate guanylyltransferase
MCGGKYKKFKKPRQLLKINGEVLIERTIRQLRENGITDICISTECHDFDYLGVTILYNKNNKYSTDNKKKEVTDSSKSWLRAYYLVDEPVCYLHGDTYFSDDAIKKIVNKNTSKVIFFCTPDKKDVVNKSKLNNKGREPLGFKVQNYNLFNFAVNDLLKMVDDGKFKNATCPPISWTVYRYLNGLDLCFNAKGYGELNSIFRIPGDYMIINDETTDIDFEKDIETIEKCIGELNNE